MKLRKFLSFLLMLSFSVLGTAAEISGLVTTRDGSPLPFVNIYQAGTTNGTTSNHEGLYTLEIPSGKHLIVFQYIGYKEKVETILVEENAITLHVQLEEESIELASITINADAEDPAYAVIRKAIEKRKYYRDMVQSFSCDAYIKGNQKLLDAPEKIMGQEIGDIGGVLDSNRQGILYLSESLARIHFQRPKQYKEEMISSKVSGDANGFSFNQARMMYISLYENQWDLNGIFRPIISPIANNALLFYKYKLIGTFYDKEGRLVNKIEVIPKRELDPVYHGHIYIIENLWNIHSTELMLTKDATKFELVDTFHLKQLNINIQDSIWVQLSQTVNSSTKQLGFDLVGFFTGNFSNYKINPTFDDKFFDGEVFRVLDSANLKSLAYWNLLRPVPLTEEESEDYVRKDSLEEVWHSKEYLDSMDRKDNRFKLRHVLLGYQYNRSYKKKYFSIQAPLNTLHFNTVQGWNLSLKTKYKKEYDDYQAKWWEISSSLNYGFAEKRPRATLAGRYNFNNIKFSRIGFAGGLAIQQFMNQVPLSPYLNDLYSLFVRENHMKLYEKLFGKAHFRYELFNGLILSTSLEFAKRRPLVNHSNYSFLDKKDKDYEANDPLTPENVGIPFFDEHNAFIYALTLRYKIKQKYISYPYRKITLSSPYPVFWLSYKKAIPVGGNSANFDHLSLRIWQKLDLKLLGTSRFNIEGGVFLTKKEIPFVDYKHFNGNETVLAAYNNYYRSFQMMPYHTYSGTSPYLQVHYDHHFDGFIWNKIPFLKKLGFTTVGGVHYLYSQDKGNYLEFNVGIDDIGWKLFRYIRVDFVTALLGVNSPKSGVVVGINLPVN